MQNRIESYPIHNQNFIKNHKKEYKILFLDIKWNLLNQLLVIVYFYLSLEYEENQFMIEPRKKFIESKTKNNE